MVFLCWLIVKHDQAIPVIPIVQTKQNVLPRKAPQGGETKEDALKGWRSMAHVKWECKYHVVFIPKYRKKVLYGYLRKRVGEIFQNSCRLKGIELRERHAMPDHVHIQSKQ